MDLTREECRSLAAAIEGGDLLLAGVMITRLSLEERLDDHEADEWIRRLSPGSVLGAPEKDDREWVVCQLVGHVFHCGSFECSRCYLDVS